MEEDIALSQDAADQDYEANLTEEESAILSRSFRSADFDNDKTLTETEITMAISRETKQHITVSSAGSETTLSNWFYFRTP